MRAPGLGKPGAFFYDSSIWLSSASTMGLLWLGFGRQLSSCFKRQRNDCNAPNTLIEWRVGEN